ncbi:MAG: RagB/SusD family nutrient uptake outer membrane protein, partial [Prevotella sp.]|nr:RagB/SusD family nutrient uptake outer membrane protein [Prevotella sp.]
QFVNKFSGSDIRGSKFFTTGQDKDIKDLSTFSEGYAYTKFTNLYKDGTGVNASFVSTDFPVFRLADVYLMLAECQVVGGVNVNGHDGIWYFNQVRERANADDIKNVSANDILDERARELAWECHRRSDLVRFNKLTTSDYLWAWKGSLSSAEGNSVDNKYNLYPLPASDKTSNTNLIQNPGY